MFEAVKNAIRLYVDLSDEECEFIYSQILIEEIKKKEFLLVNNTECDFLAFVIEGSFRSYFLDSDNNERVYQFFLKGHDICDYVSLATQSKSQLNIQALENSKIVILRKQVTPVIFENSKRFQFLISRLTQVSLTRLQNKYIEAASLTAQERLEKMIQNHPDILQRIPQNQIASYLGITQTFMSLLKKKVLNKS